ncbi:MAG: hypothetical protein ACO1PZ_03385 [Gammaproteobacteria bacterium]
MNRIRITAAVIVAVTGSLAGAADLDQDVSAAPSQCMSPCEPGRCAANEFAALPDFSGTLSEILASCQADRFRYAYAVEGVCSDGAKILATGTGYTSNIRLFTADGEFESQLVHTDVQSAPCMGQFYWPRYRRCESPVVVETLCGYLLNAGDSIFADRWNE